MRLSFRVYDSGAKFVRLSKGKKRVLMALGSVLGTLLLIWFSAPLWFPWVFRPVAAKLGLRYERFERRGYSHFTVRGAGFTNEDVRVSIGRTEGLVPTVWLWRLLERTGSQTSPFIRAENWSVEVVSGPKSQIAPAHPSSTFTNVWQTRSVLADVCRWIPVAVLSNGIVRAGDVQVRAPALTWRNGDLAGNTITAIGTNGTNKEFPARVNADFGGAVPHTVEIVSEPLQLLSQLRLWIEQSGLRIQGSTDWQSNQIAMAVSFGRNGSLPDTASLRAANLRVPGKLLKIEEYRDIAGAVEANWTNGAFNLSVLANATPIAGTTNFPPARMEVKVRGDTNAAIVESANISSPWVNVRLTRNVSVYFRGPLLQQPALLAVEANLDQQPWIKLRGILNGEIRLSPTKALYPLADFILSGTNVGNSMVTARSLRLGGELNWPWLSLTNASADLENGSVVSVDGGFNPQTSQVSAAHLRFNGPLLPQWMPAGCWVDGINLELQTSGALTNLTHHGRLAATNFAMARIRPVQIEADWNGTNLNVSNGKVNLATGPDSLLAEFSTQVEPNLSRADMTLQQLNLRTNGQTAFAL